MTSKKFKTSVSLDEDVLNYLDKLAREADRDRSWVVNALARHHAKRSTATSEAQPIDSAAAVIEA